MKQRDLGGLADAQSLPLQVCLGIAASVSLGLKQHVLFLDSTGGFTASRLYQILRARAEDGEEQASSPGAGPSTHTETALALASRQPSEVVCLSNSAFVLMGFFGSKLFLPWLGGCRAQGQTLHFGLFFFFPGEKGRACSSHSHFRSLSSIHVASSISAVGTTVFMGWRQIWKT